MITYCEGRVHTNTIENFWNCLKRTIHGTYICPKPFHLEAYLDEQVWRFNNRKLPDGARLDLALEGIEGKRITYKALTKNKTWRLRPGRAERSPLSRPQGPKPPKA